MYNTEICDVHLLKILIWFTEQCPMFYVEGVNKINKVNEHDNKEM